MKDELSLVRRQMEQTTLSLPRILEIHNLSSGAGRALLGLLSFRNGATGQCNPKLGTLSKRLGGVACSTLRRWLHELRRAGIVEATKHRGASSYVFNNDISGVFHTVKNNSRVLKNEQSRVLKNEHSGGSYPYMNLSILEEERVPRFPPQKSNTSRPQPRREMTMNEKVLAAYYRNYGNTQRR
jgi:hypothetical protein